jgi:acylphosphatase
LQPDADPALVRRIVTVYGRVQGVGYRWYCTRAAADFAIAGTVRNLPAGDELELDVQGAPDAVERFLRAVIDTPPPNARVERTEEAGAAPRTIATFSAVR